MRRTTSISLTAAALLAGIALGRAGAGDGTWFAGAAGAAWLTAGLGLAALALRRTRFFMLMLTLTALGFGLWRAQTWKGEQAQLTNLIGQTVILEGIVADDPAQNPKTHQVDFTLSSMRLADPGLPGYDKSSAGNLTGAYTLPGAVSVHSYPVQLQRGYRVRVSGKVKAGYGNSVASLGFPKIQVLSTVQTPLERLRQRFFTGMRTALPEPLASFGLGLLVGIRALIPKPMQTELALVGLSHLVAVSGYNLTIIVSAADRLLKRFGRGIALAGSLWLIAGFLIVTGGSASIVRAGLVSVLTLLASFYGRRFHPVTLIGLTAAATVAYNPKYLTDLGWLLSFLAFFGILVLAPAVEARLGNPKPVIARLAVESLSAQLLTLPLIMYFFGQLSIVAPLTNLIILPMVPLAMAASFAAGLAGLLIPAFCGWLAWPAMLILGFIIKIIDSFAALPWAGTTDHLSLQAMLAMYVLILAVTVTIHRNNRRNNRKPAAQPLLEPASSLI